MGLKDAPSNDCIYEEPPMGEGESISEFKYSIERYDDEKSYKVFKSAAVVCNNEVTCTVGKNILAEGGSVIDAAIASMLTMGVVSFQSAGLGGGFFLVHYDTETNQDYYIDARAEAPANVDADIYCGNVYVAKYGRSSIGVPGELAGYWAAHKRHGKLSWCRLFEPAIDLAENGFEMTAGCETWVNITVPKLKENGCLRRLVTKPDGTFKKAGDKIIRHEYAETLRTIATDGPDAFYNGSLTDSIVKDVHDGFGLPSAITYQDFVRYKARVGESTKVTLNKDRTLITSGAPSGGPVLAFILNILKGYNFSSEDLQKDQVSTFHRIVEAIKFAFCKRTNLGDPDFNEDINKIVKEMTCGKYCDYIRQHIDDYQTHQPDYYGKYLSQIPEDPGTAHIGILGPDGSGVAITSTVNHPFGSNVVGERTGLVFNDQMDGFSTDKKYVYSNNTIEPGKRAMSSTSPAIILENSSTRNPTVKMIVGGAGSARIINSTVLTIMNYLWFGENLNESVRRSRMHHAWDPNILQIEEGTDEDITLGLKEKGHEVEKISKYLSTVQAIAREGKIVAKCDCRKGGYPDGY